MIGLRRHIVQVVEHDLRWAELFAAEAESVRRAAGPLALEVEHVGSTAVPGLAAKPILDLAVSVRAAADVAEVVRRLVETGYLDRGDQGREGGYLLVRDAEPDVRTIHLHIVTSDDEQWAGYLTFRDALRQDAGLRSEYAALKLALAAQYPGDRERYTDGKQPFIHRVISSGAPRSTTETKEAVGDLGFTYQTRKSGEVEIFHHGHPAATLRGRAAIEFLAEDQGDFASLQQAMARLTGNYRRGNERLARTHPRNQST